MDLNDLVGSDKPTTQPETPAPTPTPEVAPTPVAQGETAAPPAAADQDKMVPFSALDAERKGRKDWKAKALRIEGEANLLKHQLEEARRAPQPTPQQREPEAEFPDPILDPQGYRDAVVGLARQTALNERLTSQEEAIKEKHGSDAVEAAWTRFATAAQNSPALRAEIGGARNPWAKLMEWDKRQSAQAEIGDDPAAYREKLEKELRAKWEAEQGQLPAPTNPTVPALSIPASLATAPNVGNRGVPQYTGPSPLSDLVRTPRH